MDGNENQVESRQADNEGPWIWKNGMVVRTKRLMEGLTKKVEKFNRLLESVGATSYRKDMLDLNCELIEYFGSITDNFDVRDLFDFLTMSFCEYEHFFKEHKEDILSNKEERTVLLPLAYEIIFNDIQNILDFITNNTVNC